MERPQTSTSVASTPSVFEDQVRDYRLGARRRYNMSQTAQKLVKTLTFGKYYQPTLEQQVDPEKTLQLSSMQRASLVPAEVLYHSRPDTVNHKVYMHWSEESDLVVNRQYDSTFIRPESYATLMRSGMQFIHIGLMQVRIQILHRAEAGTLAMIVFRDCSWRGRRSMIAKMEVDLTRGSQMVYIAPKVIKRLSDFYNNIQISILTKGYDDYQNSEANLLITKGLVGRLSNTSNVGFAYSITGITDYFVTHGVQAIKGQPISTEEFEFLGATIGNSKIKLQEHIIKKIADFKEEELKTTKGLRSWLGILNYARRYIPNLGKTLGPLYSKISPTGERRMNDQDWDLIRKIKRQIHNLPDLEIPPEDAFIILEVDGCMEGWGGVCKWRPKKNDPKSTEKICAYASGKFDIPKSTIDAEIHAVMNCMDKFKIHYLDKKELLIRTDCQAIMAFYNKSSCNKPSRVRWIAFNDFLTGLGIPVTIEHIDGKNNVLADALSRLVCSIIKNPAHWQARGELLKQTEEAIQQIMKKPHHGAIAKIASLVKKILEDVPT
uniref:ORF III n=1 Tax=Dioscorea bacilliform virus TaxID=52996 RepID=Q9WMZ2_9VIRU|nr:unnamed protein product [Dioscorea bacilliform virus]